MGDTALSIAFEPLPEPAVLERRWRAVEACAPVNIFTSWTWIGAWLRGVSLAGGASLSLLSARDADGREIGLALIGEGAERRMIGTVPCARLNEAGTAADRAFIEYNAPLAVAGRELDVARAMGIALGRRRGWRVLRLSGVVPGEPLLAATPARRKYLLDSSPAHFVDLESVRAAGDYLSLLSANTRAQIRRSIKEYSGLSHLERAGDVSTATAWLDRMAALNAGRHVDNAWDDPVFRAFAAELVIAGIDDGTVDLLRLTVGEGELGYLITLLSGPRALNYQSAFADPVSARAKPGLMTHAAAVDHYAAKGMAAYSFLAGRDRYKQSLATDAETLEWWALERFSMALEAEYWLRRLFRRERGHPTDGA